MYPSVPSPTECNMFFKMECCLSHATALPLVSKTVMSERGAQSQILQRSLRSGGAWNILDQVTKWYKVPIGQGHTQKKSFTAIFRWSHELFLGKWVHLIWLSVHISWTLATCLRKRCTLRPKTYMSLHKQKMTAAKKELQRSDDFLSENWKAIYSRICKEKFMSKSYYITLLLSKWQAAQATATMGSRHVPSSSSGLHHFKKDSVTPRPTRPAIHLSVFMYINLTNG